MLVFGGLTRRPMQYNSTETHSIIYRKLIWQKGNNKSVANGDLANAAGILSYPYEKKIY